ncbi:MAG: FHA domain-containing protein [Pseudomonadota bacterium]
MLELKHIEGPEKDEFVQTKKPLIMACLAGSFNKQIVASDSDREKIKKLVEELFSKQSLYKNLKLDLGTAEAPKYDISGRWEWLVNKKDVQLSIRISKIGITPAYIEASGIFTHPAFIRQVNLELDKQKAAYFSKRRLTVYLAYADCGLLILMWLYLSAILGFRHIQRKNLSQTLPATMGKLENLIRGGYYVSAGKLIESCLNYFPNETDLLSIKARLEIITEGRLKDAEKAFVKAKIFKTYVASGQILAPKDQEDLLQLPGPEMEHIRNDYTLKLLEMQEENNNKAAVLYKEALELISRGKPEEAIGKLGTVIKLNAEDESPLYLFGKLIKARSLTCLKLVPLKVGKEVWLFKTDCLYLGREDSDIIIEHPKISRQHLRISLLEKKIIAEDLESTNFTYLRGEKLKLAEIEDGDILDLAGTHSFTVHIAKAGQKVSKATMANTTVAEINDPAVKDLSENDGLLQGMFLEGEDRHYLLIIDEVGADITAVGILYNQNPSHKIVIRANTLMLCLGDKYELLYPGEVIEYQGIKYEVEE